jgi:hypothetical protein
MTVVTQPTLAHRNALSCLQFVLTAARVFLFTSSLAVSCWRRVERIKKSHVVGLQRLIVTPIAAIATYQD